MDRHEMIVEQAVATYFSLYVQDWAEQHHLSPETLKALHNLFTDFYYFAEGMVESGAIETVGSSQEQDRPHEVAAGSL